MSIVIDEEFRKLAEKALKKWGLESQTKMMIEECAELIQVLVKQSRNINGANIGQIVNELVDVEIMLGQMKNIYGLNQEMWADFRKHKLYRLKKLLEKTNGV